MKENLHPHPCPAPPHPYPVPSLQPTTFSKFSSGLLGFWSSVAGHEALVLFTQLSGGFSQNYMRNVVPKVFPFQFFQLVFLSLHFSGQISFSYIVLCTKYSTLSASTSFISRLFDSKYRTCFSGKEPLPFREPALQQWQPGCAQDLCTVWPRAAFVRTRFPPLFLSAHDHS